MHTTNQITKQILSLVPAALLLAGLPSAMAQHGHLNAGAVGTAQGDKLNFANGDLFAANSGYVKELTYTSTGDYAGLYAGNITLTALPQTIANGGPAAGAPALGSFLQVRLDTLSGPPGGVVSYWDHHATLSLSVGAASPTAMLPLSDASLGAGTPSGDPFGHLHGRQFTASLPGEYVLGLRVLDTSANGLNGGPIHTPSDLLFIRFQAVPEPSTTALAVVGLTVLGWNWLRRRNEA